jgi:hypothetical protein
LSKCKLDLSHPKFRVAGNASEKDLQSGLDTLSKLIAQNHLLSGFTPMRMKRYPEHQNRVWRWDFRPAGETSSTRGGWRLYAYRFDLDEAEPVTATAFLCYDKDEAPTGDYVKFLVRELKRFLAETAHVEAVEDKFRRQPLPDGTTISLCYGCGETAGRSADIADLEIAESTHECQIVIGDIAASSE